MRRRKGRKEKNTMDFALLVFVIAITLAIFFGRKKLLDTKGPFCKNVIKNPARRSWEISSIDAKWLEMMCVL